MDNFSMIRTLNMMLKSYEIVYIFVTPSPPLTRRYLITENVDNSGRPLRKLTTHNHNGKYHPWKFKSTGSRVGGSLNYQAGY